MLKQFEKLTFKVSFSENNLEINHSSKMNLNVYFKVKRAKLLFPVDIFVTFVICKQIIIHNFSDYY